MYHAIRPGLHYARGGGHTLFLDLHRNRYFALAPAAEPDIERLEQGYLLQPGSPLVAAGLVIPSSIPFTPPGRPIVPRDSILDAVLVPGRAGMVSLLAEFAWARISLALAPKLVLRRAAARTNSDGATTHIVNLQGVARAYRAASKVAGAHDQCLAWSLAVVRFCRRRQVPARCLIGVSFRPFSAHAWVQSGDHLVNDRYETVRNFTPILVL